MTIFDDQIDLYVTNQKPGLIVVWNRNPNEVALRGYYVTYDAMTPPVKAAAESWLGPPAPPPPPSYGVAGRVYQIRCTNRTNGNADLYQQWGPITNLNQQNQGFAFNSQYWIIESTGATSATNPARVTASLGNVLVAAPPGNPAILQVVDTTNGQVVLATGGGGVYPPLVPADVAVVDAFFLGLRSIGNPFQPIAATTISQLVGQVEEVKQTQLRLEPKIEETRTGVRDLGPPLTEIELNIPIINLKLNDILDCTCRLVVQDCDGDDRTGLQEALKVILSTVCQIRSNVGFFGNRITIPGTPPTELRTVRDSVEDIMRRIGYDRPFQEVLCGDDVLVSNLRDHVVVVLDSLGFNQGVQTGQFNDQGEELILCSARAVLQNVVQNPGELSVYRGVEVDSVPVPILKINFNEGTKYAKAASMQIPNPVANLTRSQIRQSIGPKISGDWLCQITFTSGRKILGWFDNELDGLAYLQLAAGLSAETIIAGSGAATHNPADAPTRYSGVVLSPWAAFVIPTTASGLRTQRISLT